MASIKRANLQAGAGPVLIAVLALGAAAPTVGADDIRQYAQKCADEVGAPVQAFDCLEGTVIPMDGNPGATCEKPPYLPGAGCFRYSRIGQQVTDDGVGIPDDVLPKIFEPHFSTRTSGSGLGLAISRSLVDAWGGEIAVSSTRGSGTRVVIALAAPGRT